MADGPTTGESPGTVASDANGGSGDLAPAGINTSIPHSARIWNYWLGGKDNFAADRAAGDEYIAVSPTVRDVARASRGFLVRSIEYLTREARIRQFLDIGTGLPTAQNTDEVAQAIEPSARIVYVDHDPLVLAHARALLTSTPQGKTWYIDADLREPDSILTEARAMLDFDQPLGLILSGVLGHIPDTNEASAIVQQLLGALPAGSYLSLNDGTSVVNVEVKEAQDNYNETGAIPYTLRSPEQIASFFEGLELVDPASCPARCGDPTPPTSALRPSWTPSAASVANPRTNSKLALTGAGWPPRVRSPPDVGQLRAHRA